ncbi:alpha-1,2-mannosidase, putative [Kriegella aquimaris]|uniref:Alpha-1,2-mannosidase, putative n=2 Tax=Kriegella aquimaris TaxID=192904 RepID=A0A1G9YPW5_9FLAO|nr:alpha-1,2-mannosidase, putative [Kriegella aquimaris]
MYVNMQRSLRYLFYNAYIILFLSTATVAQSPSQQLIWSIGQADGSHSEFALTPNRYAEFAPKGFGGANRYYVVGKSKPENDWPYILPGPKDDFAGYGYWSGRALHKLPIYFELEQTIETDTCKLVVDILEVSSKNAPLFRAFINGKVYEHQLRLGRSGDLPERLNAIMQTITFSFPSKELRKGVNEIIFQNMTGGWCVFDGIKLIGPKELSLGKIGNTVLKSVAFADFEMKEKNKDVQPLLVDILQQENNSEIKISVDGQEMIKKIEVGNSILEFYVPAVSSKKMSEVNIYIDGKLKYKEQLRRTPKEQIELSDYVDQFMGTSGSRWMITPGPRNPMPMVQLGPNNQGTVWKAGYEYQIESVTGFNHTQEWTMAGFLMMPTVGALQTNPGPEYSPDLGYRSRIDKSTEKATIGKYSVDLTDYNIHVDLTATTRAGLQRYIFPKSKVSRVIIDGYADAEYGYQNVETEITRLDDYRIEGYVHHICDKTGYVMTQDYKLYFALEFNKPFESMGGWTDKSKALEKMNHGLTYESVQNDTKTIKGSGSVGAIVNFKTTENDTILVRSSISLVSTENAWLNLKKEITEPFDWNFEQVVKNQQEIWNKYLGRIEVQTDDYLQKVKFYTNLYRALSGRMAWGDVNGQWLDMNEEVQTFDDPDQRLCSGEFWNTFWNVQQLNQLIVPEFSSMQVKSLLAFYDKGGWLSKGIFGGEYSSVMVAEHAIPWIVGAWNSGINDFDFENAYKAMHHVQTTLPMDSHPGGGRVGNESLEPYLKYGYVPLNTNLYQSYVSNTLEYAFDDWCLAQAAKVLKKDKDYKLFMDRAGNWQNIFDPKTGFMRPKNADGTWHEPFDPYHTPGFVEGNAWQFSWFVPHNMKGLVDVIGKERFVARLDSAMHQSKKVNFNALGDNFSKYPINHGNQPNMQSSYLFNYAGASWLTQKWAREIQEKYYGTGPRDAYPGDEDQGQMSAWYVMSTLGLFQMDGGAAIHPQYEIGSPRFEKVTIHLSDKYYGGNTFVIKAKNASRDNKYIHAATLNGNKLVSWKFPQKEVIMGGELLLEMKDVPYKDLFKK